MSEEKCGCPHCNPEHSIAVLAKQYDIPMEQVNEQGETGYLYAIIFTLEGIVTQYSVPGEIQQEQIQETLH